jgi:hypothetical protein
MAPISSYTPPASWAAGYRKVATGAHAPATYTEAVAEVQAFLNPVLDGTAAGIWHPDTSSWAEG